jgi:glycosyltransferase involved in cell wall biosynthesis
VGRLSTSQTAALVTAGIDYSTSVNLSAAQMREAYEQCDIVAFTSTYEGFGMPIVEANAIGRPVVTSNVAAMPEVAADAACLVNPFEIESIRSGIERVINDAAYRHEIVANGFDNAARFAPTEVAKLFERIYTEVDAAART